MHGEAGGRGVNTGKGQLFALPLPTSRWIPQGNLLGNRWCCQRQKERDVILILVINQNGLRPVSASFVHVHKGE